MGTSLDVVYLLSGTTLKLTRNTNLVFKVRKKNPQCALSLSVLCLVLLPHMNLVSRATLFCVLMRVNFSVF